MPRWVLLSRVRVMRTTLPRPRRRVTAVRRRAGVWPATPPPAAPGAETNDSRAPDGGGPAGRDCPKPPRGGGWGGILTPGGPAPPPRFEGVPLGRSDTPPPERLPEQRR